eukprot:m.73605 g.73605  ORF g.73605 m.73605 type:complete len:74 (-) comp16125_c0_seq1:446-667(-)
MSTTVFFYVCGIVHCVFVLDVSTLVFGSMHAQAIDTFSTAHKTKIHHTDTGTQRNKQHCTRNEDTSHGHRQTY